MVNTNLFTSSSQSKPAKNTSICSVWQENKPKNDVLKQFLTFFQLALLNSKITNFLLRFSHRSSWLKKVLNRKKNSLTAPKMDMLFVTLFATKF